MPSIAPTIGDIGLADRNDILGFAVLQCQAFQVMAILCRQSTDDTRLPKRHKAIRLAKGRQATEQRINKRHASAGFHRDVMDNQVSADVVYLRHKQPIVIRSKLIRFQNVFQPPKLIQRRYPHRLPIGPHSHAAIERPLKHRQSTIGLQSKQKQLPRLIGHKPQAQFLLQHPVRERTGRIYLKLRCGSH